MPETSPRLRLTSSHPRRAARITIERLRTLLLIGFAVLVAAIAIFLVGGHWARRFLKTDLPRRLGVDIEQSADGVDYTQTRKGKTIFKIHAARAVTRKTGGLTQLHDVRIDLYGDDGNRSDTIAGSEFEYDPNAGVARAAGQVEITMMRPGVQPAVRELRPANPAKKAHTNAGTESKAGEKAGGAARPGVSALAGQITDSEIHVKTSGLVFYQKTGVATTAARVDFALRQGSGNAVGATYDSAKGQLVLDRAVAMNIERGNAQQGGGPVAIQAGHAEFARDQMVCTLSEARAEYTGGTAQIANATIHFRDDGSVIRLDGAGGVDLKTASGGEVTAPQGWLEFTEDNRPSRGMLAGGAKLEMTEPKRQVEGAAASAQLTFDRLGELSQAHLERDVVFTSSQQTAAARGTTAEVHRTWTSHAADVTFAAAAETAGSGTARMGGGQAQGRIEPRTIHGFGGVVVTSETTSEGVVTPSRLTADTVVAELAPGGVLSTLTGNGHAGFAERTAAGAQQGSTSDQLEVHFVASGPAAAKSAAANLPISPKQAKQDSTGSEIASVVELGHVVLIQTPPEGRAGSQSPIRATATRADYDGASQVLHLSGTPRVQDGALDMTADRIDFARASGDAFAHGDVKASWLQEPAGPGSPPGATLLGGAQGAGGNGPIHAIAAEAELHQGTEEVVFRQNGSGSGAGLPRLWQAANSVSAPRIVLNRKTQTLLAEASGAGNPVRTVLVGNATGAASGSGAEKAGSAHSGAPGGNSKPDAPSVIRVRSGDLHYAEADRLAIFRSGSLGAVTAETAGTGGTTTVVAQEAEAQLTPAGTHAGASGETRTGSPGAGKTAAPGSASVDRLTAQGHVVVDWPDRRGTGEKLVYRSEDGTFTLTGTASAPPRMTDAVRGTVTGSALIFHSRSDSVTVEGDGGKTETETRSKK